MAVTQQIARLPIGTIQACAASESVLDELLSFRLAEPEDYLDLDWSPAGIKLYFEGSKQLERCLDSLEMVLDGSKILNEVHRNSANGYTVYSDITMTSPAEVASAADGFDYLDWHQLESFMPASRQDALELLGVDLVCHPNEYYLPLVQKLCTFVGEARENNMGLAQWWD